MGILVEVPPFNEGEALDVIVRVGEEIKRGKIKYLSQIGGEDIEKVEKYLTKLVATRVAEKLVITSIVKKAEFEWVGISPSSVHIRVEVETRYADMCSSGDLGCIEARVDSISESKGYEIKLAVKYPGKRVVAKRHLVFRGSGVSYFISASLDAEEAGIKAIVDPEATAEVLADAVVRVLLA